jgi:putative ABC transport system permease protein
MYKSYLKIGWRSLLKHKGYSLINVGGLTIGMAVALLIGLWVFDELNFNKTFKNYERLGLLYQNVNFDGQIFSIETGPHPLGAELKNNFQDFEEVSTSTPEDKHVVSIGEKILPTNGIFTDPQFLKMFSVQLEQGSMEGLKDIHSIMLCKTLADALIGEDAVGKIIKLDNNEQVMVTGVFRDFPGNSAFKDIKILLPLVYYFSLNAGYRDEKVRWGSFDFECFVLLKDKNSFTKVESRIKNFLFGKTTDVARTLKPSTIILPMSKWHLYADFKDGINIGGKIKYVWMFGTVGMFVLLLACINFMNLSTARSESRSKEVGIRKVMGSARKQLISQFLAESLLVVAIAFVFSLFIVALVLPMFNTLIEKQLAIPIAHPYFILVSLSFMLVTGFLAGSYPALYLSSFNSVKVLKGVFKAGRWAAVPRQTLVVFQFTISVALAIGTVIVFQQIQYAKNRPVGFDREGIIYVPVQTQHLAKANYNSLRHDLLESKAVKNMAISDSPITGGMQANPALTWEGKDPSSQPVIGMNSCSHDFPETHGFRIIEGRMFTRELAGDSLALIVNESAAKLFAGKEKSSIGKKIKWDGKEREVIGVIKDQIRWSPFAKQQPHLYFIDYKDARFLTIRLDARTDIKGALAQVETVLKKYDPGTPFEYKFIDDEYARQFKDEELMGKLASLFSSFAVFISCVGIFGLASFAASQRTKEICIRKVLGASMLGVWRMLSRDFVLLVVISIAVAAPLAFYCSNSWLQQYDYRITISWWIFAASGVGALLIALITVSYQSIKTALINPVAGLRGE